MIDKEARRIQEAAVHNGGIQNEFLKELANGAVIKQPEEDNTLSYLACGLVGLAIGLVL